MEDKFIKFSSLLVLGLHVIQNFRYTVHKFVELKYGAVILVYLGGYTSRVAEIVEQLTSGGYLGEWLSLLDRLLQSRYFSRTKFEQHGTINVYGVGSLIGGMMEAFGQRFLQRGAKKVAFL